MNLLEQFVNKLEQFVNKLGQFVKIARAVVEPSWWWGGVKTNRDCGGGRWTQNALTSTRAVVDGGGAVFRNIDNGCIGITTHHV